MRRVAGCVSIVLALAAPHANAQAPQRAPYPPRLVVLDIEITGDLGPPELAATHEARLRKASDHLRAELARTGLYEIVDQTPARDLIEKLRSEQPLYQCNGCELDIARRLDAQQVLVAWVHRMSALVLTLTYEIRNVEDGEVLWRVAFDFRGDNDAPWLRAVSYLVRDLQERSEAPPPA